MRLYSILILALLLAVPAGLPSCQSPITLKQPTPQVNATNTTQKINAPSTITLASFNIQIFGQDKMADAEVVNILKQIVKQYDVVMIQEVRDISEQTIPEFVRQINEMPGNKYLYVISDRLGDSASKEQYAILYNNATIALDGQTRLFPDVKNLFEREPFSAKFSVKGGNLDFVAMDVHMQPSNAAAEIDDLDRAMEDASAFFNENDVIVGGDLNSDCSYWDEAGQHEMKAQMYEWLIPDDVGTNLNEICTYDRFIVYDAYTMEDYTGEYSIFNFKSKYGISDELARKVSDHFPIWIRLYSNKDTG